MKVTVEVTKEDIASGKKCSARACPLASAMGRSLGYPVYVSQSGWGDLGGERKLSAVPEVCIQFISRFDADEKVKPFSFELEVGVK